MCKNERNWEEIRQSALHGIILGISAFAAWPVDCPPPGIPGRYRFSARTGSSLDCFPFRLEFQPEEFRLTISKFLLCLRHVLCCFILLGVGLTPLSRAQTAVDAGQVVASTTPERTAEMQKVVDHWDDAVDQHDQYALELVLAPQYIDISDTGEVFSRDQVVSQMVAKDATRYSLSQKVITVRMVGDVAIVNGTYDRKHEASRLSHAKMTEERGVFSQVYVRARNSWACINSQQTLIQEKAEKASKKKSKEDSTEKPVEHDLGFHFPGMHHSTDNNPPPK